MPPKGTKKGTNARSEKDKTPPRKPAKKKAAPKKTGEAKTEENEELARQRQEEEEAQASLEAEQKRQEKEAKATEKRQKEQAAKDYKDHLANVEELKEMTDTSAWKKFYASLQRRISKAGKEILDVEKSRDVVRCQETVKVIKAIIADAQTPVSDMNVFCHAMPLFAANFPTRASWNSGVGCVDLSGQEPTK